MKSSITFLIPSFSLQPQAPHQKSWHYWLFIFKETFGLWEIGRVFTFSEQGAWNVQLLCEEVTLWHIKEIRWVITNILWWQCDSVLTRDWTEGTFVASISLKPCLFFFLYCQLWAVKCKWKYFACIMSNWALGVCTVSPLQSLLWWVASVSFCCPCLW